MEPLINTKNCRDAHALRRSSGMETGGRVAVVRRFMRIFRRKLPEVRILSF